MIITDVQKLGAQIVAAYHSAPDLASVEVLSGEKTVKVVYLDELIDKELLSKTIIEPLQKTELSNGADIIELNKKLPASSGFVELEFKTALDKIACGWAILIIESAVSLFGAEVIQYEKRSITEPPTASVLKGPREGFTEDLKTNLSLIRRRLRSPLLAVTGGTVGEISKTPYAIVYIDGVCDAALVTAVRQKIESISIDGVPDSSYIARLTESRPRSIFKQTGMTEKPDILMAKLLEGRLGVLVDGSPMALTYPFVLFEDFQDSQDYYRKSLRSTFLRFLRLFATIVAVLLPAFYVAVREFEYQMIPLKFLLTILNATDGIPLTPTLEMLVVVLIFEMLNEAGVRMPRYVGMALSIVGAVVLGDTAVKAGLISSPAVLISALSSTGIYCVPDQAGAFSLLRITFVTIAGVFGLYGLLLGLVCTICYLTSVSSFGSPYMAPFAPFIPADMKDSFIKSDLSEMRYRPLSIIEHKSAAKRKKSDM